jgi:hypothetical protein
VTLHNNGNRLGWDRDGACPIALAAFRKSATIKTHVPNVLTKLGLRDRIQAVVFAHENGVVTAGE